MGSNCCKGDASRPLRSSSSIYSRSRAGASLDERFTSSEDAGGVRLTVSAARAGDSAVYTLQATNSAGKDTARVRLEVSPDEAPTGDDPPTFLRRLQDLTVKVGTRTRFLVEIVSSTECKVTWYRNERRLMEAERVSLVRDGTFWCADIAAVSVDDTGRWTCTAENAGGRASCSAHLNVLVPKAYKRPEFVEELRALLTEQGTVSLECKVVGVPTPVLRWFKDSREIKAGDVFALTANAEDPTSLGTYTCEAVNCMGRAYSSSKVHVVGRSREGSARPISSGVTPESPPIFTKELEDKFVRICEHLTLSCHIVVPPWPRSVVWYNKEGKVEPGDRYHVVEDGVGGYLLEVQSAEWPDEGEWKCVATSSGGRVGITSCYVSMEVPKNYRKPRFMENLQAVLTEEGLVSFECKVVGFPTPVLSWFKDGQELKPGDVYQLTGTNSLGSYCCIARNCMGQASSSAELTVEDIQNQLNEEEKAHLFSKNQAPKFIQGLKSVEAKIDEPFRFTIKVAIPPEPSVQWFRDEQPVDESTRCHLGREDRGGFYLDIQSLEFLDQAEWKCVALNDFGHSVTSCFLKLIIPRHYKKPRFLENLQAILSDEGAVNLECKVIGVPQPVLKWYKDGEELKPGDIHRIISGQDGTCCLGTYTCEAQNCMGIAASSASLLGFDDSMKAKAKKKTEEQALQRNLSLSTIHEERTSQMYDTPVGDITLDDKGEISFSFDGKEVSVSLYETPDLTEEEALQIVEMYADQLSENVTEHNVVELPPLRFVKETSTSGNLLMEAIIIDVSPEYFASPEEDLRTEADVEDISIADEMGPPQLSLDQDVGGEDYLEKTMALLSDEKADIPKKMPRKKSDSQRSIDDFYSLSMDPSLSEDKKDDDTQNISESFASAKSLGKPKSKSLKPSAEDGQESSDVTKTILYKDEPQNQVETATIETPVMKPKRERRRSRSSRRSSSGSEKSLNKSKEELVKTQGTVDQAPPKPSLTDEEFKTKMINISTSLSKVINDVQIIERDIILKSELMSSAATASRSLEIISSLIKPLSEIHSIADAAKESALESRDVSSTLFSNLPQSLKVLQQSLTIIEKCIDVESDNKTLVKKTCVAFIETCGEEVKNLMNEIIAITEKNYLLTEQKTLSDICSLINDMHNVIKFSEDTIKTRNLLSEASEIKSEETTVETKHLRDTQKAIFELKSPLNSLLCIVDTADSGKVVDVNKVTSSEVILNDMSASIQDLQAALEHIESLSVKESTTSLYKYNTGIIETVMDSVLKLRSSFEQLPTETKNEEDEQLLKQALVSIKNNLSEISSHIETIEKNVGSFDILQSDNKLEVLQKMAQILILLENNLPRLESMPKVKTHMVVFHKNLTRILENVIESNDAQKYFTLMEICDAINRLNASLKNLETDNVLALASLSNTFRIIQDTFIKHIFESELNCSILTNISEVLLSIQEALNHAEEISLQLESERAQDIASPIYDSSKANVVVEHIEHTIAVINTIKSIETTKELKNSITPALENICPVLEELKRNIASAKPANVLEDEHISEMSDASFVKTLATPLLELNNNILVLNQVIVDNLESLKENTEVVSGIAEPLHELHTTLEILQQDVISQYGEDVAPYEVSVNVASAVHNLQSCMVMIQEQPGVEGVDDMSTLEDISGIKTTAETIPSDRLVLPTADEIAIEHSVAFLEQEIAPSATAQALQTLNQHITILQNPEIVDALDTLSEVSDYSSLKSVALGLGELHTGIEEILHPFVMENSSDIANLINTSKLAAIAEPMQELQQSLSVLDTNNIPIYEHILEIPSEKIHSVLHSISDFKQYLGKCIQALFPAMETADKTIEISNKVEALREVCENLKEIIVKTKAISKEAPVKQEVITLEGTVNNLLDATDVSKGIQIQLVKNITEELFEKVITIQEELIQFTPHTAEKLTEEAKLIQAIDDIENNIAVLEQYDFVDLSRVSDITSCATPQLAMELESEPLVQMDDILQNAVNVLQDSAKETPLADLMILEDFFKTCKCEFTIIRLIISKSLSHKKIIRLIQEFSFLQNIIKDFKLKRSDLQLSDDIDGCLRIFFLEADGNLKTIQESLLKLVESQSELLFASPMVILQNANEDLDQIRANNENLKDVASKLIDIIEVAKPVLRNITVDIQEELKYPTSQPVKEVSTEIIEKIEDLLKYTEDRLSSPSLVKLNKKIILNLTSCLQKHQDYKDATGTGKHLIILKCLSECVQILKEGVAEADTSKKTKVILEDNALKAVLSEMLEPLHALHSQLKNIQEQVTSGVEEKSVSVDITTTESMIEAVSEIHKEIVQQIESAKSTVDVEDISLMMEADKQIHAIQDSLKSLENISAVQELQEIAKPIDEVEKSLHSLISSEIIEATSTESLPKEKSTELLLSINQFIELTETVEEITAVVKIDELKESANIARELRDSITLSESEVTTEGSEISIQETRIQIAQKLQDAISAIYVQVFDNTQELASQLNPKLLGRFTNISAHLQDNLARVTGVQTAIAAPTELKTKEVNADVSNKISVDTIAIESATVAEITKPVILEQLAEMSCDIDKTEMAIESIKGETETKETVASEEKMVLNDAELAGTVAEKETAAVIESCLPIVIEEAEQMKPQDITENQCAVVDRSKPEVAHIDQKHKEASRESTDGVKQCIENLLSADMTETLENLTTVVDTEKLKQTVNIAKELRDNLASIENTTQENSSADLEIEQAKQAQAKQEILVKQLQNALLVVQEQIFENYQQAETVCDTNKLQKVSEITVNLQTKLSAMVSTPQVIKEEWTEVEKSSILSTVVAELLTSEESKLIKVDDVVDQQMAELVIESEEIAMGISTEVILQEDKDLTKEKPTTDSTHVKAEESIIPEVEEKTVSEATVAISDETIAPSATSKVSGFDVAEKAAEAAQAAVSSETKSVALGGAIISENLTPQEVHAIKTTGTELAKANLETLIHNIETFVSCDISQILHNIPDFVSFDVLKQSVHVANELRKSIEELGKKETVDFDRMESDACVQQVNFSQQLQNALIVFQNVLHEKETELLPILGNDKLQRVKEIVSELVSNLSCMLVTSQPIPILQAPFLIKSDHIKDQLMTESVVLSANKELSPDPQLFDESIPLPANEDVPIKLSVETVDDRKIIDENSFTTKLTPASTQLEQPDTITLKKVDSKQLESNLSRTQNTIEIQEHEGPPTVYEQSVITNLETTKHESNEQNKNFDDPSPYEQAISTTVDADFESVNIETTIIEKTSLSDDIVQQDATVLDKTTSEAAREPQEIPIEGITMLIENVSNTDIKQQVDCSDEPAVVEPKIFKIIEPESDITVIETNKTKQKTDRALKEDQDNKLDGNEKRIDTEEKTQSEATESVTTIAIEIKEPIIAEQEQIFKESTSNKVIETGLQNTDQTSSENDLLQSDVVSGAEVLGQPYVEEETVLQENIQLFDTVGVQKQTCDVNVVQQDILKVTQPISFETYENKEQSVPERDLEVSTKLSTVESQACQLVEITNISLTDLLTKESEEGNNISNVTEQDIEPKSSSRQSIIDKGNDPKKLEPNLEEDNALIEIKSKSDKTNSKETAQDTTVSVLEQIDETTLQETKAECTDSKDPVYEEITESVDNCYISEEKATSNTDLSEAVVVGEHTVWEEPSSATLGAYMEKTITETLVEDTADVRVASEANEFTVQEQTGEMAIEDFTNIILLKNKSIEEIRKSDEMSQISVIEPLVVCEGINIEITEAVVKLQEVENIEKHIEVSTATSMGQNTPAAAKIVSTSEDAKKISFDEDASDSSVVVEQKKDATANQEDVLAENILKEVVDDSIEEEPVHTEADKCLSLKLETSDENRTEMVDETHTMQLETKLQDDIVKIDENINKPSEEASVALSNEVLLQDRQVFPSDTITESAVPEMQHDSVKTPSESGELVQHIDVLISEEMAEAIEELATVTDSAALKNTVEIAKELRECLIVGNQDISLENATPSVQDTPLQQGKLKYKLNEALINIQTTLLDSTQDASLLLSPEKLERISKAVTHVMEDLKLASISEIQTLETEFTESTKEESMKQLECLLQEVTDKIDLSSSDRVPEDTEALRDSLDEVQTVIIKLKRDFDGANDTLNETLEDLECSVRSVQLQINEDSPPDLLKEACATLQLLVNNMSETNEARVSEVVVKEINLKDVFEKCSNETSETVQLLEKASNVDTKVQSKLGDIVSNLNTLTVSMKSLKSSFVGNAETLIEKGIDIMQSLDQMEEKVFLIEKELDSAYALPSAVRDNIVTAVHSVYGSISNMRSTISTAQKQYIFENYGKPSENLIHSIKNVSSLANSSDDEVEKAKLKKFSKSLRNVLNHFEDIKFYINLDKTARLPSDAAFTKVILEELKCNVQVLPTIMELDNILKNKISNTLNCIETNLHGIEERSTLEVKEKIPIFKDIASKVLDVTSNLKVTIENRPAKASSDMKLFIKSEIENEQVEVIEVAQDHTTESLEAGTVTQIQISEEMAIAVESPKDQIEMGVVLSQAENKIETTQSLNEIALASASEQVQEELVKAQSLEVQVTGQITDTVDITTEAATAQEDLLMAQTQVVQATDQITDIVKVSLEAATAVLQESSISADDKQKVAIENIDEKHIPESAQQLIIQESDKEEVVDSKTQKMEIEGKAGPSTRPDTVTESSATTHSETEEAKSSDGLHSKEPEDQSVKEKTLEALHEKSQNEIQTDDQNLSAFEEKHSSSEEIKLSEEVQIQEKDQHLSTSPDQKDVHSVERSKVQDEQLAFDKAIEKPSVSEDESSGKNEVIEANKRPECKEFNLEEKMDEIKPGTSKGGEKLSKEDKVTLKEDQTQKNHMLVQVGIEEQMKIIERVEAEATEPQKDKKSELEKNAKLKMENQSEVFKSEEQEDIKIEEDADNLLSQEEKTVQKEDKVVGEQKGKEFKEVEDKRTKEQQKENDKLEVENREKLQNVPIEAELKEKEMEAKQKSDLTLNKQEAEGLRHEEKEKQQEELKEKELLEIQTEKSKLRDLKDLTEEVILKQQKASELLRDEKETRLEKVEQQKQKEPEEKEDEEEQLQQLKEKETNEKQIKKQEEGTEILRLEEEKKQKELLENEEQQKKKHEIKQKEEEEIKLMEQANETEKHKDEEIQLEMELATKQKEDELKQTAQENETQILRVKEDRKELADNKEKDELQEEIVLEEKRTKEQREEMERIEEKKQEDDTQKQMLKELEIQKEELKIKEQEMSTNKLRNEEDKKQQETELTKQPKEEETKLEQQKEEETKLRTQKEEKLKIKEQEIEVERLRVEAENKQKEKEEAERKQTEHEIQEEEQRKELEQKEERIKEQEEKRIKEQEETRVKKQEEKRIKEQQDEAERLRMEEEKKQLESLRVEEERRLKEQEETDLKVLEDEKIRREKEEERKRKELTEKQNEEELIVQKEKDLREKRIKEQQKELEEQKRQEELFKKEEKDKKQKEQEERHIKEQEEAERLRVEEEMKQQELLKQEERERTQRELALKQEEEELKVKKEKDQEERRIKEEEAKRLRVEEEMKQQELLKKEEEERKQTELALKKEEEELKLKKEKELEERRIEEKEAEKLRVEEEMKQQELLKKENEERKQRELALKKEEEELKIKKEKELEERHINEIEAERLRVEEEMKRQELLKKEEEEQKQRELAIKQEEAELKVKKEKELEENRIKEEEAERLRVEEEINRQELLKKEEEERKQRELAIKKEEEELKVKKEKELEERRIKEEEAESLRLEEEQKQQELLKKEEEERRKEKLVKKKKDKESKLKKEKELEEKRIKEQEEAERLRLEKEKQRMEKEEDERKQKELLEKQNEENKLKKEKELEEKRTKDQEEAERLRLEAEKKQAEEELKLKEKEAERLKNEKESKQQEEEERRKKEIEQKRKEEMELKERQLEEERLRLEAEKKKAEEELKLKEKEAERLKIEKENNEQEKEERRKKEIEQKQKEELELKERQKEEERLRREVEKKQVEEEERRKKEIEQKQKEELKEQQEKEKKLRLDEEKKQIIKKEEEERKIELEEKNKENEMELKKECELEEKRIKEQQEEAERLKLEEENKRRESLKRKKDQRKQKQLAEKQAEEKLKRKEDEQKEEELKLKEKELEESRVKEQQENEKLRIDEDNKLQEALKKEEERKQKEQKENELKHKEKELEDKRIKEERDRESEKQRIQKEEEKAIKLQQKVQEEEAAELKKKEDEQRLLKVKAEMEEKRLEEERRKQNDLAMQKVKEEAEKLKQEKAEKKRLKKAKETKAEKKASKCVEDKQELEKSDIKSIEVGSRNGAEKNIETVPEDLSKPKLMTSDDGDDIKPDDLKKRAKKKEDLSEKTERDSSYSTEKLQSLKTDHSFSEKSPIKLIDEKFTRKDLHEEKGSTKLGNDIRTDERIKSYATSDSSQNYIKEYHYEPTARPKHDDREKPRFVDHNHRDYTMEFARPSAYREKTIEIENISFEKNTGRGHIYKANNLMMDAQLRASAPPRAIAPESSRRSEPVDRRSEAKHRSKALSEARSIISEKRSGASRDIKRKPVFSTFLTDRTAVEGSRVKLTCSVLSSSDPKVTWYKNGVLLDNKLKYRTKIIDGLITLEVLNAVPSDSAEYSCTVENENGSINTSANLKVYPSFEASPIPPTFTRSIRDTYHLLENELVLECRIRGQPLPSITWLKDDKPVSMNERFQAYYLADGVCRLAISAPTPEDSGKYTCKAENSVWSDQITHIVNFTGKESRLSPNLATIERLHAFSRQSLEARRPHFGNVLTDYKVTTGGTIGLQVEIKGSPTRVEWLREGHSVMETYSNARTYVEQGLYTLALSDVTEKESGLYTCRAWSNHGTVDMNAAITVVQPNEMEGKPAIIVGRPEKDVLISVGEDLNITFRVQGEPKPKVIFMKGIRDITNSQRVCKMTSDDYVKFTVKRSVISDAGTYCILARNAYGCDRAFVTVVVRQRASSENLISDWTYPMDDSTLSITERNYKSVPDRIPGEPSVVDGGSNWLSIAWPKPDPTDAAPVLAYKVESWLAGKEGGARWTELGITPLNSFDAFNLRQGEEYHFRVTPRNRYGWGESVQTSSPIGVGLAGDRPEFVDILPGLLKVLIGETANLSCSVRGKPTPEVVWMKNGHEVDEDARVTTSFNGFNCSLVIKGICPEDEARYSCEATNVHGRASTYARVAVVTDRLVWEADAKLKRERSADASGEYPPQFTMRLRDRRVQATYPVRLTCQVVGSPPPSVTWFKDGEEVEFDKRHTKSQDEHFHTLEIAPTTLEDGGLYEAMARNSCGAISCHCNLVVDKGIRAYVAPEFCCGLEPLYRLREGEELRISAVVEAYPTVGVTWYRDGVRLRPSRRAIMTLDRDGQIELALAFVTPRDARVYTCTASNEVGRATTSGKVEVIGDASVVKKKTPPMLISPDVPYSKEPMFIRKPRSSEAREGDTVIIQCEVVGDPKPDVYWLRDFLKPDYYRDATHFKRVGDGPEYRFEIPHAKLDYTGAYSVVARNVHGEAKAIISLQILAKDPSSTEEHNIRYGRVDVIPRFERNLTDLLCYDGDAIEFECHVSGHPEPDIRWFHYNELIRENPDFEWSLEDGTARLKIKQVTAEDEGTYLCEASNSLGKATSSACLVVYPPGEPNTLSQRLRRPPALLSAASTPRSTPRSTPARSMSRTPGPDPRRLCSPSRQMPPKFYTYPFNKVVEEGETVVFQCAVKGLPAPWATWDKDGVIITPSARITIKEKDEILRILEIEEVTIEDVGVYRITLENDLGRVEASARLEVITQKGKFYAGVRSYSPSPRKSLTYRRRPSRQD